MPIRIGGATLRGRRMRRVAVSVAVVLGLVAVLDISTGAASREADLPDRVVDMQHPTTLLAKLDRLRSAPHPKVVLLGDSLVYGGILEEFGDPDWREHGLGPQLAA